MAVGVELATSVARVKSVISESQSSPDRPHPAPTPRPTFTLAPHNPLSACTFFWIFRLLWKSLRYGPEAVDVALDKAARAEPSSHVLSQAWKRQPQSLLEATFAGFGFQFLLIGFWKLAWAVCTWLSAYWLLQQMMRQSTLVLAVALLVAAALSAVTIQMLYQETYLVGLRVRSGLIDMIYNKSMVLSPANVNIGHIMTLIANDIEAICDAASQFHFLWSGCVEVVGVLFIAWILAGWRSALAPILFVVVVILPIQVYLGRFVSGTSASFFNEASERLHLMTEFLTAIKLIKFYAWEGPARDKVAAVRSREAASASLQTMARAINFAFVFAGPLIATLTCLLVLQLTNAKLDPVLAFTLVSLFNTLRYPLLMMPLAVKSCSSALNGFRSIDAFLRKTEMVDDRITKDCGDREIIFRNASCKWEKTTTDTLHNISIEVKPGEILAVIGDVGSGKSSLIAAMLGQMKITSGSISARGLMSYCPQEAWLINSTLKENILFGTAFDAKRYAEVISICSLERDLSLFPEGDQVAISERGANLSGGQRQRVSMARAVYSHSDIVLLDDPLSALDQAVGRHIFDSCFKTYLSDRAVVLVTHQLQYLPECTRIAIVDKGRIAQYGSYPDLMAEPQSGLRALMTQFSDVENNVVPEVIDEEVIRSIRIPTKAGTPEDSSKADPITSSDVELKEVVTSATAPTSKSDELVELQAAVNHSAAGKTESLSTHAKTVDELLLIQKAEYDHQTLFGPKHLPVDQDGHNDRQFSRTVAHNMMQTLTTMTRPFLRQTTAEAPGQEEKWITGKRAWARYLHQAPGLAASVAIFAFFWVAHCFRLFSDIWVKVWQGAPGSPYKAYSLGATTDVVIYAAIVCTFAACVLLRGVWWSRVSARRARDLHDSMLRSLLRAPMAFYDKTPLGRILQSASKHQSDADDRLPDSLMQWMQYLPLAIGSVAIMTWQSSLPVYMLLVIIGLVVLGCILIWSSRRSGAVFHSKEQTAISKTILFSHITASLEGLFSIRAFRCQQRFRCILLDNLDRVAAFDYSTQCFRFFIALYIDVLCSVAIFFNAFFFVVAPTDSATVGLSLSNALQLLVFVQWTLRMWEESQAAILSIGNLQYLSERIPSEAPAIIETSRPPSHWPVEGHIDFIDVMLRYSTFGVIVLKQVSFTIHAKEKIGIVGRTGSGKSTLLVALLRIVELAAGRIVIDGLDISTIGLEDLRRKVAIIPQESVLFSGTIRENLDPTNSCADDAIWHALEAVNLAENIRTLPGGFNAQVVDQGPRFSLGQRQLFCIARAILMKSNVIVLDEATAAIDAQTDALVQKAITDNFADCTVLTIAHRLNTIIQSDRILMMNAGKVVEFDKPFTLLSNPTGHFYQLVQQTGPETSRKLRTLAQEKFLQDRELLQRHPEQAFLSQFY